MQQQNSRNQSSKLFPEVEPGERARASAYIEISSGLHWGYSFRVKLFYTGPVINTEMLVMMLEKHGIAATQSFVDAAAPEEGDLNRPAQVFVPEADYGRAHQLFYAERDDEL